MPPTGATTLHVRTVAEWRAWLARHHGSKYEVWLVFHKPKSGVSSIAYGDAVDEALCFGWVDSLIKRIDDATYARKFTPRRPDSRWSAANRQRYARLEAAVREAGYAVPAANLGGGSALLIKSSDAHAWAEIYLAGMGWILPAMPLIRWMEGGPKA